MSRVLLALSLIVPPVFLAGCGSDSGGNSPTKTPEAAQQEAAKMPPPPSTKPAGKK